MKNLLYEFHFERGRTRLKAFGIIFFLGISYALINSLLLERSENRVSIESLLLVGALVAVWPLLAKMFLDTPSWETFSAPMREGDLLLENGRIADAQACYYRILPTSRMRASRKDRVRLFVRLAIVSREASDSGLMDLYLNNALDLSRRVGRHADTFAFYIVAKGFLLLYDYDSLNAIFEDLLTPRKDLDQRRLSALRRLYRRYIQIGAPEQADVFRREALTLLQSTHLGRKLAEATAWVFRPESLV